MAEAKDSKEERDVMSPLPEWFNAIIHDGWEPGLKPQTQASKDYVFRQEAIREVAKADPNNIQEVAASQLSIINSYYESGLQQSQRSFQWSLIWGSVGFVFFIGAVGFLLLRQPTEVAFASGIGGAIVEVFAGIYLSLYKHASDQLAAFRTSLESTQRLLLANSMCEKLSGDVEQTTRAELIRLMVQSAVNIPAKEKGVNKK
ncbi:MAG: hypothetical protein ABI406_10875 [Ktedonobacteraceae bacterium]